MDLAISAVVFLVVVAVVVLAGVGLGMLLARRIDRFTEPKDEADRADDD